MKTRTSLRERSCFHNILHRSHPAMGGAAATLHVERTRALPPYPRLSGAAGIAKAADA
jgi:hypothetical protein